MMVIFEKASYRISGTFNNNQLSTFEKLSMLVLRWRYVRMRKRRRGNFLTRFMPSFLFYYGGNGRKIIISIVAFANEVMVKSAKS